MSERSVRTTAGGTPWVALLAMLWLGCGDGRLRSEDGSFEVAPDTLAFGAVLEGERATATLEVRNLGRTRRTLTFAATSPFSVGGPVELGGGEVRSVKVTFHAGAAPVSGTLDASDGARSQTVTLSGEGVTPLDCVPSSPCHVASFDLQTRACVEMTRPDGDGCVPTSLCLDEGVCVAGTCVGQPRQCDDQNACTDDACAETVGCVHTPRVCPPSTRACHVAVCEPDEGCGEAPAQNLTPCGELSCESASLCMAGNCQVFAPAPDGMPCGMETPCRAEATCLAGTCDIPEPTGLVPTWSLPLAGTPVGPLRGLSPNVYVKTCDAAAGCALESFTGIATGGFSRWIAPLPEDAAILGLDAVGVCTAQGSAVVTLLPATGTQGVTLLADSARTFPDGTHAFVTTPPGAGLALAADGARHLLAYAAPLDPDAGVDEGGADAGTDEAAADAGMPDGGVLVLHTFEADGGLRDQVAFASEDDEAAVALGADGTTWIHERGGVLRRVTTDDAGVARIERFVLQTGWTQLSVAGSRVIAGGRSLVDEDGALVAELALPDAGVPLVESTPPWVLMDAQTAYLLARPCEDDGASDCRMVPTLSAYATEDGGPRWSLPLDEDGTPRTPVEAALLGTSLLPLTGVGVLFDELEGTAPAGWVRFYAEGAPVEACRLPGSPKVHAGLFQESALYAVVERDGAYWLEAYALDPFTARTRGWPQREGISATRREH